MNVFQKRPLALILCITVGGFTFSSYGNNGARLLMAALSLLLLFSSFLSFLADYKCVVRYCALSICVTALFSFLYFECYFKAENKFNDVVEITATVEEIEPINSYTMRIVLDTDKLNGKKSSYKLLAYLPIDVTQDISSGDIISATATISGFTDKTTEHNNFSKGISGRLDDVSSVKVIGSKRFHIPTVMNDLRETVSRYITMISDAESGAFLTALLIGDRDKLSEQTRLDFKRIGISHILALSGMHLALLSFGVGKALSALGVKKKLRICITSVFIILYMALTGFSASVLRAGIMIIIYSALFLLSKSKDSFTSLCCSVFIILVFSPHSVFDVALWLSALATLGIIVLYEYCETRKRVANVPRRILKWFTVGILSSVFAISATLLISVYTFGGISLLGVISTLIFSILTEIIMYLGCVMIIIGWFVPIGKIIIPLCKFTLWLANMLSANNLVYVNGYNALTLSLIAVFTAVFFGFVLLKIKRKEFYVSVILSFFIVCHIVPLIQALTIRSVDSITYYASDSSDDFLLSSRTETCLISSAKYSKNRAYSILDILDRADVTLLHNYYITHYSRQLEDELEVLLGNIKTDKIFILSPQNEEEEGILKKLQRFLANYSTELILLEGYESFTVGKYRICPLYSAPYGEETSMNAFSISSYTETFCYISSGLLASERKTEMYNYIKCADRVIFGCHGKKYKNRIYLDERYPRLSGVIINSTNVFLTQSAMEEYEKNGCDVISHPSRVELLE